jgi:Clp amino terminal domain, pathogenicity island component
MNRTGAHWGDARYEDGHSRAKALDKFVLTDRSYVVLAFARDRATRQRRKRVRSDDVLWGLSIEATGVASSVLRMLGLEFLPPGSDRERAISKKRGILRRGWLETRRASGDLRRVLDAALSCGTELFERRKALGDSGNPFVGTEHLLSAIIGQPFCAGYRLLETQTKKRGLTPNDVRLKVLKVIGASG